MRGNELEIEMERAIQEAQEETDEQSKVKEQVGTRALGAQARIQRIVVKKRSMEWARPRRGGGCRNSTSETEKKTQIIIVLKYWITKEPVQILVLHEHSPNNWFTLPSTSSGFPKTATDQTEPLKPAGANK